MSKKLIQFLFAILILFTIFYSIDLNLIYQGFKNLKFSEIFLLFLISIILVYISALKWQLFVSKMGEVIPVYKLYCFYLAGLFVNLFTPSYLGGDAVRTYFVGKSVGQHEAAAATILERLTGLFAMLSLAVVFVWITPNSFWIKVSIYLLFFGFLATAYFLTTEIPFKFLNKYKSFHKILSHVERVRSAINLARKDYKLLSSSLFFSYLFHLFAIINVYCTAVVIGWNPSFGLLFTVVPLILVVGSIPITPSGLGIQEGAYYFFLGGIGATTEQAVLIALILRAKTYILALFGGLVILLRKRI